MSNPTQPEAQGEEGALEHVVLRNHFYRDGHKKVMAALMLSLLLNGILLLLNFYQFAHRPHPKYFAARPDGQILPLKSLSEPALSRTVLLQWAQRAIVASNSFDFLNFREQMNEAAQYYSESGWNAFRSAQEASGNLRTVIAKKLSTTAVATGAPVVLQEGVANGRYMWRISMPILVTYESSSQKISQSSVVTLLVRRDSTLNYPRGVSIAQYIAQQQSAS